MKDYLIQVVKEKLGNKYDLNSSDLYLLKLSTPNSGWGACGKVIFLIFKNNDLEPLFCIKTVRQAEDNVVIEKGFSSLQSLYNNVEGGPYAQMFPQPLFISHDDNGTAFSVEKACPGHRPEKSDLAKILESYDDYQIFLAKGHLSYKQNFDSYVKDLLISFGLPQSEILDLENYYQHNIKKSTDIRAAVLPQHSDLTFDNMFVDKQGPHIFDCERFGVIKLAGFDVFHLLSRVLKNDSSAIKQHLSEHLIKIDNQLKFTPELLFAYILEGIFIKKEAWPEKLSADLIKKEYAATKLFL